MTTLPTRFIQATALLTLACLLGWTGCKPEVPERPKVQLGEISEEPNPVEKRQFDEWTTDATLNGTPDAFLGLGLCHALGEPVEKDLDKARENFTKAREGGSKDAEAILSHLDTEIDDAKVAEWKAAAGQGDTEAALHLGIAHLLGTGVERKRLEALKWMLVASAEDENKYRSLTTWITGSLNMRQIGEARRRAEAVTGGDRDAAK